MKRIQLLTLTFLTWIIGCKSVDVTPKPTSEFTYTLGTDGKVQFNNLSTDATTSTWNFGDSNTETNASKSFVYQYSRNGSFQVALTSTSKSGSDVVVKTVNVSTVKGSLIIYKKFSTRDRNINVYVDGKYYGAINGSYYFGTTAPDCGNSYSVTISGLTEGSHSIEAKETGLFPYSWTYSANVKGGLCNTSGLTL